MPNVVDRLKESTIEVEGPLSTPCWIHIGAQVDGYTYVRWNGLKWRTNRLSWRIHFGEIPEDKFVLHKCDVRACWNPDHLFIGTAQDNTDDMESKGRDNYASVGENHGRALIKEVDIPTIRQLCAEGANHSELARRYGVSPSAIDKIAARRTWRHVP